jgi:hypothetical protein
MPGNEERTSRAFDRLDEMEWWALCEEAVRFQLGPVLHRKLDGVPGRLSVPGAVRKRLKDSYLRATARNIRLFREVEIILGMTKRESIPVIVLKGAALAEAVHRDIGLRPMGDVDLLVRKEDLRAIDRLMTESGYRAEEFRRDPPADVNEFHYHHVRTGLTVEIHWELFPAVYPFALDTESLWKSAIQERISGVDALVLDPADFLMHVCLHATVHMYAAGIRDIYDAARLIEYYEDSIDWERLIHRAKSMRIVKGVYLPLLLASRLLNAAVPEPVLARLRPADYREEYYSASKTAVLADRRDSLFRPNIALLFGNRSFRDKMKLLRMKIFPSRELIASLYPIDPGAGRIDYIFFYAKRFFDLARGNLPGVANILKSRLSPRRTGSRTEPLVELLNWTISP